MRVATNTPKPLWVRVLYKILELANKDIHLLPYRWRAYRYKLWDDYCLCKYCEKRRRAGEQGPYKGKANRQKKEQSDGTMPRV